MARRLGRHDDRLLLAVLKLIHALSVDSDADPRLLSGGGLLLAHDVIRSAWLLPLVR